MQEKLIAELREWISTQEIYTDPDVDYDSHDLSEKGGYKSAMWNIGVKIDELLSRHEAEQGGEDNTPNRPMTDKEKEASFSDSLSKWQKSEQGAAKPKVGPVNLIELKRWVIKERNAYTDDDPFFNGFMVALCNKIDELTTRPKPDTMEPLACLAKRKKYGVEIDPSESKWTIRLVPLTLWDGKWEMINGTFGRFFEAPTYAEAEVKARAYLSTLADKGGE